MVRYFRFSIYVVFENEQRENTCKLIQTILLVIYTKRSADVFKD